MEKSRILLKWFVCAIYLSIIYCEKLENHDKDYFEKSNRTRRKIDDWYTCDFSSFGGCPGFIADERWQLSQEDNDLFLSANFKPGETSLLTYARLVKPSASNQVCIIVKHFRNVSSPSISYIIDENLPKIYIGVEPELTLPQLVEEISGSSNEWKTAYYQLNIKTSFRLFFKVQHMGDRDATVAFQYFEILKGNCNRARKRKSTTSKFIQEEEQVGKAPSNSKVTETGIKGDSSESNLYETKDYIKIEENFNDSAFDANKGEERREQRKKKLNSKKDIGKREILKVKRHSGPFGSIFHNRVTFDPFHKTKLLRPKKEVKNNDSVPSNKSETDNLKKFNTQSKGNKNIAESGFDNKTEEGYEAPQLEFDKTTEGSNKVAYKTTDVDITSSPDFNYEKMSANVLSELDADKMNNRKNTTSKETKESIILFEDVLTKDAISFKGRNSNFKEENISNENDSYEQKENFEVDNPKKEDYSMENGSPTNDRIEFEDRSNKRNISIEDKVVKEDVNFKEDTGNISDSSVVDSYSNNANNHSINTKEDVPYINIQNALFLSQHNYPRDFEDYLDHGNGSFNQINYQAGKENNFNKNELLTNIKDFSIDVNNARKRNNLKEKLFSEEVASEEIEHSNANKIYNDDNNTNKYDFNPTDYEDPKNDEGSEDYKVFNSTDEPSIDNSEYKDSKFGKIRRNRVILTPRSLPHAYEANHLLKEELIRNFNAHIEKNHDHYKLEEQNSDVKKELAIDGINFPKSKQEKLSSLNNLNVGENMFFRSSSNPVDFNQEDRYADSLQQEYPTSNNNYPTAHQTAELANNGQSFVPLMSENTNPQREKVAPHLLTSSYNPDMFFLPLKKPTIADYSVSNADPYWSQSSEECNQIYPNLDMNDNQSWQLKSNQQMRICGRGINAKNPNGNEKYAQNESNYSSKPYKKQTGKRLEHDIIKFQDLSPKFAKHKSQSRNVNKLKVEQVDEEDKGDNPDEMEGANVNLGLEDEEESYVDQDEEKELEADLDYTIEPSILKIFSDFQQYIKKHQIKKPPKVTSKKSKKGYTSDVYAVFNPRTSVRNN